MAGEKYDYKKTFWAKININDASNFCRSGYCQFNIYVFAPRTLPD